MFQFATLGIFMVNARPARLRWSELGFHLCGGWKMGHVPLTNIYAKGWAEFGFPRRSFQQQAGQWENDYLRFIFKGLSFIMILNMPQRNVS